MSGQGTEAVLQRDNLSFLPTDKHGGLDVTVTTNIAGQRCPGPSGCEHALRSPLGRAIAPEDLPAGSCKDSPLTRSPVWLVLTALLQAVSSEAMGQSESADCWLERALDLAEPQGLILPFLLLPTTDLIRRHSRRRTSHGALVRQILDALGADRSQSPRGTAEELVEPLSASETRVLRYLPTNLSAAEIARELYVSVNTVKTHLRNLYAKLDAHGRTEAVEKARALGLLAPRSSQVTLLPDRATQGRRRPVAAPPPEVAAYA